MDPRFPSEPPPFDLDHLLGLFTYLDTASMNGTECAHDFALTRAYLTEHGLDTEEALQWLGENGAGCDCEVMFNVAEKWEEAVGYIPPDDNT